MSIQLPERYYRPERGRAARRPHYVWLAILLTVASGWLLFSLPGTPVRRYIPPADMPWYGFGYVGVFIERNGTWVIQRSGYADRMGRYNITPAGELSRQRETGTYSGEDASGSGARGSKMPGGSVLNVKPSPQFYEWLRNYRFRGVQLDTSGPVLSYPVPSYTDDNYRVNKQPFTIVRVYRDDVAHEFAVLVGYHHYAVYDAACFVSPYVFMTSNQLQYIHRLYVDDTKGIVVREELTRLLPEIIHTGHDAVIARDPKSGMMALLVTSGDRYWINPRSLEVVKHDKLPGQWNQEYAAIFNGHEPYNFDLGYPLTERGYKLLMRSTVIVFLASLLWLASLWSKAWRFTAAATIADSSSSKPSSNT